MTNEELMQGVNQEAINRAADYYGCSQAVLGTIQDEFGIGNKESFKAATSLSGGIARRGESCGAIIGALMVLGLLRGREIKDDTEVYQAMIAPSIAMCDRFREEIKKQFGFKEELKSTLCHEIQERILGRSFNLNDEADRQEFENAGGHDKTRGCPVVCGIAAQIAADKVLKLL